MKHKFLILVVLVLAMLTLVGSLAASPDIGEASQLKQIAVAPSEMAANAMPQAELNGVRSKAAMIPVFVQPSAKEGSVWSSSIAVDSDEMLTMMVLSPEGANWTLSVQQPAQKDQLAESSNPFQAAVVQTEASLGIGNTQYPGDVYQFAAPVAGEWQVQISGLTEKDAGDGYLIVSSDSKYQLYSHLADYNLLVGEQIGLVTRLFDSQVNSLETAVPQAVNATIKQAEMRLSMPDGTKQSLPMLDDGLHQDGAAGDGVFGVDFTATVAGEYIAQVVVSGVAPDGRSFIRTSEHVFPVLEPALTLEAGMARTYQAENNRVNVSLVGEAISGQVARYIISAEVWGSDSTGKAVPITWLSGIVEPTQEENALLLPLSLDVRWIELAGAQAPYSLRNVRVQDVDTAIPLAQLDQVPFTLDYKAGNMAVTAVTDDMLMGAKPENANMQAAAAGVVMLIHGYCSGGNTWPTSHFSNYAVFADHNQNRTHDQFARLIDTYGDNFSSFGAIAHSQGGAASLHLYTYYWSGLDYSSGNRLIQSVGTPYQGTALAGNLAVLGEIFGVGCGTNWDLSYDGASLWLSNIPSWARSRVYYHTTSFKDVWWRYDYCHIVSDVFLSDPDDGTTEKWAGQLSGAHNMGHKTGQCHTSGMRDMAQYLDSSRNANMNTNANR